ncbi:hypothetical protein Tco_0309218, partial [Tanacetum coccineum]
LRIVLKAEQKLNHIEEALPEAPPATATVDVCNAYTCWFNKQQEVSCLMLAKQELFKTVKAFHAYKQDEGQSFSTYNYNMHSMGKTIPGLHDMLKLSEKGLRKKAPVVLATSQGQIKKPKPQALVKGRGKGNSKLVYAPKQKIPPSAKKELSSKDATCYHCNGGESVARILNMVPTKKVGKMPYEIWNEKVPNLSYLKIPKGNNGLLLLLPTRVKIFVAGYEARFLGFGGRGVKQKKGVNTVNAVVNMENNNYDFGPISYVKLLNDDPSRKNVNFRTLLAPVGNEADVAISLESVQAVRECFVDSFYGIFLGKRMAYLLVENYVKNTWSKYGLVKSMMNFLMNYFSSSLAPRMEWMQFLRMVKFHDVPIPVFSEDGLSDIATKLGTPLMVDSYKSVMCTK